VARHGSLAAVAFEVAGNDGTSIAVVAPSPEGGKSAQHAWSPGDGANEPGIAAVGADRFLVTWTKRDGSSSKVRMQTLDRAMQPVGDPKDLSPEGTDASGSVVATGEGHAAVFYFRRGISLREAWVAPVRCPR